MGVGKWRTLKHPFFVFCQEDYINSIIYDPHGIGHVKRVWASHTGLTSFVNVLFIGTPWSQNYDISEVVSRQGPIASCLVKTDTIVPSQFWKGQCEVMLKMLFSVIPREIINIIVLICHYNMSRLISSPHKPWGWLLLPLFYHVSVLLSFCYFWMGTTARYIF